ncbi:Lrp/AsnC family transcriptional regulator [Pedobacter sp.]|uniref:Lrp/AsnC family transcriptional regulator n=1 Tax=Pedobacter sp. TaxID=1411316 RepID=UPI003BA96145
MPNYILDQLDLDILRIIQADGRLTNKEIAAKLRKSGSTVFERIARLRREGFIGETVTVINRNKFTDLWIAFSHVKLMVHSAEALSNFQDQVVQYPEVLECYHTTGEYDFLIKIVVGDMPEYNRFIMEKLSKLENVGALNSTFVVNEAKRSLCYPIRYKQEIL